MNRIFISWSGETQPVAEAICNWLDANDSEIKGWISSVDILGGQKWRDELNQALKESNAAIVCLGPSAIKSPWVLYEIGAIAHTKTIIPISFHVAHSLLPSTLTDNQVIEALAAGNISAQPSSIQKISKSLSLLVNSTIGDNHDLNEKLLKSFNEFSTNRILQLIKNLRNTKRFDTLIEVLKFIKSNTSLSPRDLSENDVLRDLLGKKYLVALTLSYLESQGLLNIVNFSNITTGTATITADTSLILEYLAENDR